MFEAFGFSERVLKEAYWVNETAFWKPDERNRDLIARGSLIQDTEDGLSEFPHVILNQARVHDFLLDVMRKAPTQLEPNYARKLTHLTIARHELPVTSDPNAFGDASAYPVTATLERLHPAHQGQIERMRARFVVGCDGAHSKVRPLLGRALKGDSANQAWGVMDVLAVTDFPDIRRKAAIHSAHHGSALVIPREGGYLVRLYIELDQLNENERVADRNITLDHLVATAQRILHPYTLEIKEVAWWSIYEIGQRLCDKFDDLPEQPDEDQVPRAFIAGDACHTHSPKAGQGMNVSMQDSFNLGWKLASVLLGRCAPSVLQTYSAERRAIAAELINFDREFANMFSAAPKQTIDDAQGIDPAEFQSYFVKQGRFTAGTATRYGRSILTAAATYQSLAKGFPVGMRLHSAPVIRFADARPLQLGHVVKADGRWRVFIFAHAESPNSPASAVSSLCEFCSASPRSPVVRYTGKKDDIDSTIDVRAVFQQSHRELELEKMPALLLPRKGRYQLCDYEKIFCANAGHGDDIFTLREIDRNRGCVVIVRPDQYVAHLLPLDAHAEIAAFFDRFMLSETQA